MKVLWLCNIILPRVAESLNLKASNKEGWLSGICDAVSGNHDFTLAVASPMDISHDGFTYEQDGIKYYGFYEDINHLERYDKALEGRLGKIIDDYRPDVVHIFGTEYPHALAMCRAMHERGLSSGVLIGIQGVMDIYKDHYFDGLPVRVVKRVTLRDFLKQDSLVQQQRKFADRALNELEAIELTGHVTGRTPFDLMFSTRVNPNARYHFMNETLRDMFYDGTWYESECEPHTIFLSQGNYPIKGLHYMLEALSELKKAYPDIKVYVAGDNVTKHATVKEKLKLSSYGKYLLELIRKNDLRENVVFMGNLTGDEIKARLLKSHLFVCPSAIENSPNSLGEAMILGVPCIASNVGGISGIFRNHSDGLLYRDGDVSALIEAVKTMWGDNSPAEEYGTNASLHAHATHNPDTNYNRLLEIYGEIAAQNRGQV